MAHFLSTTLLSLLLSALFTTPTINAQSIVAEKKSVGGPRKLLFINTVGGGAPSYPQQPSYPGYPQQPSYPGYPPQQPQTTIIVVPEYHNCNRAGDMIWGDARAIQACRAADCSCANLTPFPGRTCVETPRGERLRCEY
mmetsp:Transcript_11558/g.26142  ORF Transcript_11558/g.26142 Transcript_11558/m.26142 type:complete len:139 (-) Transcript_11558:142-558(-)